MPLGRGNREGHCASIVVTDNQWSRVVTPSTAMKPRALKQVLRRGTAELPTVEAVTPSGFTAPDNQSDEP